MIARWYIVHANRFRTRMRQPKAYICELTPVTIKYEEVAGERICLVNFTTTSDIMTLDLQCTVRINARTLYLTLSEL